MSGRDQLARRLAAEIARGDFRNITGLGFAALATRGLMLAGAGTTGKSVFVDQVAALVVAPAETERGNA